MLKTVIGHSVRVAAKACKYGFSYEDSWDIEDSKDNIVCCRGAYIEATKKLSGRMRILSLSLFSSQGSQALVAEIVF